MNPVLLLTHNNLDLTKRCVESIQGQDIATEVMIFDNDSTDGTEEWMGSSEFYLERRSPQIGVSAGWNAGLEFLFGFPQVDHVLVVNNDTVLPRWFYRTLLGFDVPFVSGVAVDVMPTHEPHNPVLVNHPDFSAFLIRRDCWGAVGPFDESMKLYASDCDYHIRAHRRGVPLMKSNTPYFHINSQTLKRASTEERSQIEMQADIDREVFRGKYGCLPGSKEYEEIFQ